jgi:hypothetical protein
MFSTKNKTSEMDQETLEKNMERKFLQYEGNYNPLIYNRNKSLWVRQQDKF